MQRLLFKLASLSFLLCISVVMGVLYLVWYYSHDLPDFESLHHYKPPTVSRIYASGGALAHEFATQNRVFVPIKVLPPKVINAFIAVEDQRFLSHVGIDFIALTRAIITNVGRIINSQRMIGASTITQQVAKNFLLSHEVSLTRKIREAILALRIEQALSKSRILELYLNEIYLGRGAYGVAAAALAYFNKSLDALNIDEIAFLAILPKAPSRYEPTKRYASALARRNWALKRMLDESFITLSEYNTYKTRPLVTVARNAKDEVQAPYFVETTRLKLEELFGKDALEDGGLYIHTSLDPFLQANARLALRNGLIQYDRRHGWRGSLFNIDFAQPNWQQEFEKASKPKPALKNWKLAVIVTTFKDHANIMLQDRSYGKILTSSMQWARAHDKVTNRAVGKKITDIRQVFNPGEVVLVESLSSDDTIATKLDENTLYTLHQIPKVNGAITVLDPHTGRVLAMVGGWNFNASQFNRATQAYRQPGSAFKPFVYLSALVEGYTPTTLILDAPFVLEQGPNRKRWKPANYTKLFYGPSPMTLGIEKSRNLMTVRLAQRIGMAKIKAIAARFGISKDMPELLSMSLGAKETTLLRLTSAYAMLVNGGNKITTTLLDRVQNRHGETIYRADQRNCNKCNVSNWNFQSVPILEDQRERLISPVHAYQIVNALEGVVKRGTARKMNALGLPLAGKTGTTNDNRDSWFVGFAPDLSVGVYVGFDLPQTLGLSANGIQETGSTVAAPIFADFMKKSFQKLPIVPFRVPEDIAMVRIDTKTHQLADADSTNVQLVPLHVDAIPKPGEKPFVIGGGSKQTDFSFDDVNSKQIEGLY